jgi:hypothetical protein
MVCRIAMLAGLLVAHAAFAQVATPIRAPQPKPTLAQIGLAIYPAKGQSARQQQADEAACYEWAETNTGLTLVPGEVDARAAGQEAAKGAGKGKVAQGAAVGTVGGLTIGAISGHAGKGAAIGAVAGSLAGVRGRNNAKRSAGQRGAQQAVQSNQQAVGQFRKAASACLEARGYSVR